VLAQRKLTSLLMACCAFMTGWLSIARFGRDEEEFDIEDGRKNGVTRGQGSP